MRRPLLTVLTVAVLLRLLFSFGFVRGIQHVRPEEEISDGYNLIAENLFQGHGYRQLVEWPESVQRPPGYPIFLCGIFKIFGMNYAAVQVVQALLGALGCWLLFRLGSWVHSERAGLAAALLYAVYPNAIEYSSRLYAENIYFPLFIGLAYLLCRASMEGSIARGGLVGIVWGLGILTRGTLLALPAALPIGIALSRAHRSPATRIVRWILPAAAAAILTVAPWTVRNYRLTGEFVPVSAWGWAPFYHGLQCTKRMLHWDDLRRIDKEAEIRRHEIVVERLYGGDRSKAFSSAREAIRHERVARDLVIEEIRRDPLGTVLRAIAGVPFAWFQTLGPKMRVLSLAIHSPLLLLFIAGVRRMARSRAEAFARAWPALALILFVNAFQAFIFPHVRYMSPAIAVSFLFSGSFLADRLDRRKG